MRRFLRIVRRVGTRTQLEIGRAGSTKQRTMPTSATPVRGSPN
jgi:hypothetical protein